jgi:hypothetical protein
VLAAPLFWLANLADPKENFTDAAFDLRSSELGEPPDRVAIASEQITVARDGESFRFVSVAERDAGRRRPVRDNKPTEPVWAVSVELGSHQENLSCGASDFLPGLIYRESRWTYALRATRVDYGWYMELKEKGIDWKGDKQNPYELTAEQIQLLRPLLVAELNRRHPRAKLGDRLERMLDDGLEASSTSFAPQNVPILFKWLALLMAVVGLCSMFVRPRAVPVRTRKHMRNRRLSKEYFANGA